MQEYENIQEALEQNPPKEDGSMAVCFKREDGKGACLGYVERQENAGILGSFNGVAHTFIGVALVNGQRQAYVLH